MNKFLLYKFLLIAVLIVLLLIPTFMINGVLKDRKEYRNTVISEITQSIGKSQVIEGVFFAIPYSRLVDKKVAVPIKDKTQSMTITREEKIKRFKYLMPEMTTIHVSADSKTLYRGIYKVPLYKAKVNITGYFKSA